MTDQPLPATSGVYARHKDGSLHEREPTTAEATPEEVAAREHAQRVALYGEAALEAPAEPPSRRARAADAPAPAPDAP